MKLKIKNFQKKLIVIKNGDHSLSNKFGFKKSNFLRFPPPTNPNRLLYLELKPDAFKDVNGEIQRSE